MILIIRKRGLRRADHRTWVVRPLDNTMRQVIESAVQIFRSNPNLSDDEIVNLVIESGIGRPMAIQLVALSPLAYGRVMLSDSGVPFSATYICLGEQGQGDRKSRLDALPLWSEAINLARHDGEAFFPIASRSSEIQAANAALLNGKEIEKLIWSPPVFLWPVDSFAGSGRAAKRSRPWWQFWKS
jgi:hypothetical protein